MSPTNIYLVVMVGIVALLTGIVVPALIFKKCQSCGARSMLDTKSCRKCGHAFPDE